MMDAKFVLLIGAGFFGGTLCKSLPQAIGLGILLAGIVLVWQ